MNASLTTSTGLLVSVRSAEEARCALAGGAAIIDVKEPRHGSLGRADDAVIREVIAAVGGARPVSAALGEWIDSGNDILPPHTSYVKWGLAGCQGREWRAAYLNRVRSQRTPQVVFVAYADWQCARAPSVDEVCDLAGTLSNSVLLIDTHCKDAKLGSRPPTLLDWLPLADLEHLRCRCLVANVRLALAGSLGVPELRVLAPLRPDWFAVRGAACAGHDRGATVQCDRVRELVDLIASA